MIISNKNLCKFLYRERYPADRRAQTTSHLTPGRLSQATSISIRQFGPQTQVFSLGSSCHCI